MPRYHFNPATGRPSLCKATRGKCPFLMEGASHYDTKEEARSAIEEFYSKPYVSLAGRLAVQRSRIQREIIDRDNLAEARSDVVNQLCAERDRIDQEIHTLEPAPDEVTPKLNTKPMKMLYHGLNTDRGHEIVGFSNEIEGLQEASKESFDAAVAISEEWVSKLKTEEVQLLVTYTGNSDVATEQRELLDKALMKSPPLEPTTVYSGLGEYVGRDVLRQLDSGIVNLEYPISTSLNAAQVNGFMRDTKEYVPGESRGESHDVAVEIETTAGAPLMAITTNPHEAEVLLPSGSYEVVSVRENVEMLWSDGGPGRVANQLIKLRRLG
jgi:hypothetical protein